MLFLLIKNFYWFVTSGCYGIMVLRGLGFLLSGNEKNEELPPPIYNILGLIALTSIAALFNFFMPLGLWANLIVFFFAVVIIAICRQQIIDLLKRYGNLFSSYPGILAGIILLGHFFAAHQTIWLDEGIYHAQFIKWAENYPVIPGLGNLQHRFAFNSHWHVLAALLNGSFITGQESNQINSLLYLLMFTYFISGYGQLPIKPYTGYFKLFCLILMHLPFMLVYHFISPSADYALMLMIWLSVSLAIEKWESNRFWIVDSNLLIIILICIYSITIKVSAAPLLLLPVVILIKVVFVNKQFKIAIFALVTVGLIWLPWLGRNYILSGYFIFPVKQTTLGNPVWRINDKMLDEAVHGIIENGYTLYKPGAHKVLISDPLNEKLSKWFKYNIRSYDRLLLIMAFTLPLMTLLVVATKKAKHLGQKGNEYIWIFLTMFAGIFYWLVTAPDTRFGLGYQAPLIILGIVLPFMPLIQRLFNFRLIYWLPIAALLLCWVAIFYLYGYLKNQFISDGRLLLSKSHHSLLLMPVPYPQIPTTNQGIFNVVEGGIRTCWGDSLPCLEHPEPNVAPIGKELKDGFKYVK